MSINIHVYMKKWHTWPILGLDFMVWDGKKMRFHASKGAKPICKIIFLGVLFSAIIWSALPKYDERRILSFTTLIYILECMVLEIFHMLFLNLQYRSQKKVIRLYAQINEVEKSLRNIKLHLTNRELFLPKLCYGILIAFTVFCPVATCFLYFFSVLRKAMAIKVITGYFILYKLLTIYLIKAVIKDRFKLINDFLKYVSENTLATFDCKYCFQPPSGGTVKTGLIRGKDCLDWDCIYDMCLKHSIRCIRQISSKLHHCLELWISDNGGTLVGLGLIVFMELAVDVLFWMQVIVGQDTDGILIFANVLTSTCVFFTGLIAIHYSDAVTETAHDTIRAFHKVYLLHPDRKGARNEIMAYSTEIAKKPKKYILYGFFVFTAFFYLKLIGGVVEFGATLLEFRISV